MAQEKVKCEASLLETREKSGTKVTVPRFSSEVVRGEVIIGLGSVLRLAQRLTSGVPKVQYYLKGKPSPSLPAALRFPSRTAGKSI